MKKKVLFLMSANPMGVGGGSFATHAYLRAYSEIYNGNVDVVMADVWKDKWDKNIKIQKRFDAKRLTKLQYLMSVFTYDIQRFSSAAVQILKKYPGDYECVICNGSSISGKLWKLTKKLGIRLITIHHNFEPEFFASNTKGIHRILFLPIVRKLERAAYLNSDCNLFLTNQDRERFNGEYGLNGKLNIVIGVFEFDNYKEAQIRSDFGTPLTFVVTGSLCTMQGVDGINYFFDELYGCLPQNCKVIISGRNPAARVKHLCEMYNNVTLIPNPPQMSEVIALGDIYICPTRVGGGIKLRIMDGLRLGLPVITHTCSARGYDVFFNTPYMKCFTTQYEFQQALDEMMKDVGGMSKLAIIKKYRQCFSYTEGLKRIKEITN